MRERSAVAVVVGATFVIWMGSRATAIALPLVALDQTGQAWTTGLVLGAQSIPLVTVGWWGSRFRERMRSTRAVALVMGVKVAGLAVVPMAALVQRLDVVTLAASGLVVGGTSALDAPAVRALLSDLGDRLGPGHAARALTLQDLAHRCTMFLAPPLGALAVGRGHTLTLLWSECVAVGCAAVLILAVPAVPHGAARSVEHSPSSIPDVLRRHPRVAASTVIHALVAGTWFAFSLGLALAGAQTHRPGALIAVGMTGYGLASTATSFAAPMLVNRVRPWPTSVLPVCVMGAAFVAMPACLSSLTGIGVLAALAGVTMPIGIAAHNRILATDPPPGPDRRAAFTADLVAEGGAGAVGMLAGGAVIGLVGVPATFVAAGVTQIVAVLVVIALRPGRRFRSGPEEAAGTGDTRVPRS